MAFSKIILDGTTLIDLTQDTAEEGVLVSGYTAHKNDGTLVTGTLPVDIGDNNSDVVFIDYDGSTVAAKTKAEINAMTSDSDLPAFPSHAGLIAQGWNWTVAQLKAQLTAMPDQKVYVGQMYITESGATEIDVEMQKGRLDPILTICVSGEISVDWGDETAPDAVTGTSVTARLAVPHSYASAGNYTITISVVSGSFSFYCSGTYVLLRKNTTNNENRVYANCVRRIRIGTGISNIDNYAFYYCCSLESITIPSSVTNIGNNAFQHCNSITSVTIPSGATKIGNNAFYNCRSLANIAIPSSATNIGTYAFCECSSLASAAIPSGVTSITNNMFYNCYSLASITIPSGVTSIGEYAFYYGYPLASITIPSGVTKIGNNAFYNCYGMAECHILPTTPPTLGTDVFMHIPSDCIIYVPQGTLSAYQSATNWSTYASYMREEPV